MKAESHVLNMYWIGMFYLLISMFYILSLKEYPNSIMFSIYSRLSVLANESEFYWTQTPKFNVGGMLLGPLTTLPYSRLNTNGKSAEK